MNRLCACGRVVRVSSKCEACGEDGQLPPYASAEALAQATCPELHRGVIVGVTLAELEQAHSQRGERHAWPGPS